MAITIRNKGTEAMIRQIGKRRNEGPSAVVRRLAEEELKRTGEVSREDYMRRMLVFEELAQKYPPAEPKIPWSDIEKDMDDIFDKEAATSSASRQRKSA